MLYDGEYSVDINYTQQQLIDNINAGKLTLHRVCLLYTSRCV